MAKLTQARLKELLHYDPSTGVFTRKIGISSARKGSVAGSKGTYGYLKITIDYMRYQAHCLVFLYMTGKLPEHHVDHKNHITDDNKWKNLREATRKENGMNRTLNANNTSGFCGVSWNKPSKRWQSKIKIDGKDYSLGIYKTHYAACYARHAANIRHGFHENHGKLNCKT